ncbi:MAG: hypothetical protein ABEK00_02785 [Candidatus Nanohaloarchaea archaeon]
MLQTAVSAGHEVIKSSWLLASVFVKYYLAGTVAYLAARKDFSFEGLENTLLDNSRIVVIGLGISGIVLASTGVSFTPLLPQISQVLALIYLGYLFWVY